jgi:hypothetical protein
VTGTTGSAAPGQTVLLQRADGLFFAGVQTDSTGEWSHTRLPVGDWVVTLVNSTSTAAVGETLDEIPHTGFRLADLPALLASGASTFTVTPDGSTATGEAQLKVGGTLKVMATDPDGTLSNVMFSIRHSSGFVVRRGSLSTPTLSTTLRPGSYTVCLTEDSATQCNGGATSDDTAPALVVESDWIVEAAITLP